ncbi:hypothetical protein GCK72_024468 [Caenorhabditis remanei]|uniref:Uncharacterized protein n=1 Tax=Caenorhabditis remanei TaxID=31234 RepID=A0A6A5FZT7_CAERE|nr:hypothetical protein GCK72_024468 [Caenorhabditis remanei]KAF1748001.1 hypothetical protein GCK72_024468 [Caenorhabditis remanei]
MPNSYKNQPISGFTGYIPGAKWQVGSRYVAGSRENSGFSTRNVSGPEGAQLQTPNASNQNFSAENRSMAMGGDEQMRNFTEMTNDELRERLMKMQMDMQNLQMAMRVNGDGSNRNSANFAAREEPSGRMDRRTEYENGQRGQQEQLKQRSKSMPKKIESNPFDGIESGWWSKGEVKRNQERREIANGGQMVSGGNWNQRPPSRQRVSRKLGALEKDEAEDIPAAGYSGHIQGLRQLGVGKSFNIAAKQAKKEYIERRRTYSGSRDALNGRGRGTQFSEEVLSANAVKLPDNRF